MGNLKKLEREALNLSPSDRERFVLTLWESLEGAAALDPEGIELALARDADIESGEVQPIAFDEIRRQTSRGRKSSFTLPPL